MALLTATPITRSGITPALAAAGAGGDSWANSGKEFIEVNNAGGAPITVSIAIQGTVDGVAVPARTVVVTNATRRFIGPFQPGFYNDTNGQIQLTYSGVTSVTVGVFQVIAAS